MSEHVNRNIIVSLMKLFWSEFLYKYEDRLGRPGYS